jgi:hypothetical protein
MELSELETLLAATAAVRPIFHSEADFQHAFAWQLHEAHPDARIRLETRPSPGVRLDVLATIDGLRIAFELKYLLRDITVTIDGELFQLPNGGAQDLRRYDFVKDVARLEVMLRDGSAEEATQSHSQELERHSGVRSLTLTLPRKSTCYASVTSNAVTRYTLDLQEQIDRDALPGPFQEEDVLRLPHWWGDPPLRLKDQVAHWLIDTAETYAGEQSLSLQTFGSERPRITLLDEAGQVVREASTFGEHGETSIDLSGLAEGRHIARIERDETTRPQPLQIRLLPSL